MAWKSITLTLHDSDDAEIIEQHLIEIGAVAVSYTDAADEPILEPALNTTPLWSNTNLTALFKEDANFDDIKQSLKESFGEDLFKVIEEKVVEDKVWEREWLEYFEPLKFGERLWICPESMQIPEDQQNTKNVIINMDPGMAFGTGTHETTALCLEWLDAVNVRKKEILDYGSGSGILAIAALKLGAKHAICLDIDIQAIEASLANAERNKVEHKLKAYLPDDTDWSEDETFDIILANILASPLIAIVQDVRRRLRRGGQIVLSGILATQAEMVTSVYEIYFNMDEVAQKGDWVRLSGRLKTPSELLGDEECVTICPNCDESFFVSAEDLDSADGEVRCGECDTIFFAIDFIDPDPDNIPSNSDDSFDTKSVPKAHLITGMWMHNKGKLIPITATESALSDTDDETQVDDGESSDEASDTRIIPEAHSITGLWPNDHKDFVASSEQDSVDEDGNEGIVVDENETPIEDSSAIQISASEQAIISEAVTSQAEQISPAAQMHALNETSPMGMDELSNLQAGKRAKRTFLWVFLSVLALSILALQYIHQQRNKLAVHPSFGEHIQSSYAKLNLPLYPDWDLNSYSILASRVDLNPLNPEQLVVSFNLSNTATIAQAFPIIRLSLFDRWSERIGYKDLKLQDYSPQDFKDNKLLPARGRVEVRVVIQDPGSQAQDFNVQVCLRKAGVTRCQVKTE